MFLDEKELVLRAGKGGDGAALFRREKYVPRGGPDGGDGGKGGNVIIEGKTNIHALSHLSGVDRIEAENGQKGGHRRSSGKQGEDEVFYVPLGTFVSVQDEKGDYQPLLEVTEVGVPITLCEGGNGGWGNWHFRSSIQQAPDRFNAGLVGEVKNIKLVLKLIADIGLVGLPNAGKSTFLSVVSSARPKIANYPFTTLEPQLGVATIPGDKERTKTVVIADLPGLIEGASQGKGLGVTFLKHIERTKAIIHFLDSSDSTEDLFTHYKAIRKELENWSPELAAKSEAIALSKIDLLQPDELKEKIAFIEKKTKKHVYAISAATHQGIAELLQNIVE